MMRAEADYKAWQEDDRHLGGGLAVPGYGASVCCVSPLL